MMSGNIEDDFNKARESSMIFKTFFLPLNYFLKSNYYHILQHNLICKTKSSKHTVRFQLRGKYYI